MLCASLCVQMSQAARANQWDGAVAVGTELQEVAWEALHSGQAWRAVPEAVRRAYAQSQFVLAAAEVMNNQAQHSGAWKECMRRLDMALLMGPARIQDTAHALVEWTQQQWNRGQEESAPPPPPLRPWPAAARKRPRPPPPGPIEEHGIPRVACPSLVNFLDKYMKPQVPVILTGCMTHWPALEAWQDLNYLKRVAGPRIVPVEVGGGTYLASEQEEDGGEGGGGGGWGQQLMSVGDFIDTHVVAAAAAVVSDDASPGEKPTRPTKGYLAQYELFEHIPALKKDIVVPDYCALQETDEDEHDDDGPVILNAWLGPPDTVSPTHTDPYHNLLAQVVGAKAIRLFAPSQSPYLYPHTGRLSNNSQVDPKAPDLARFPLFAHATSQACVLEAGEMLYIPPLWWHHIEALDVSFSVSCWWGHPRAQPQQSQKEEQEQGQEQGNVHTFKKSKNVPRVYFFVRRLLVYVV